jgi:lysyl-tRNA synthetase, class II
MTDDIAIPYTFPGVRSTASVRSEFDDKLEAGAHTVSKVRVAGRLMLRRGQGKVAFGQLADSSGRIQLFVPADVTTDFDGFVQLSLGDWIGVDGTVVKTRKGELSVQVEEWTLLAKTRRQFPDKWHGLADQDTRYRQRYVDLWVNEDSRRVFQIRSRVVSLIRRWLENEGFMEVETPLLHPIVGGATALPFVTHHNALDQDLFLRIAPELYLKRLIGGGFERVFELGRVFRNEGISPRHNPEFTMLEWYEAYADASVTMTRSENLIAYLANEILGTTKLDYEGRELDLATPWRRATLAELTSEQVGVELRLQDETTLQRVAAEHLDYVDPSWGPGKLLLEVYEKTTEHTLWNPTFVTEYPKEVSPLARDHATQPGMTDRFEAIVAGRELDNGFSELIDPDEQRARFEDQAKKKLAGDAEAMVVDEDYLRSMEYGFPPVSGIGIGIDRLVMLLAGVNNVRDIVLFPTLRPEQS